MAEDGTITEVSQRYRHELLGKGLHEQHVWSYFYHRNNQPLRLARTMLTQVHMATPDQLELFLSSFTTSAARCEWFKENSMSAYKMIELTLQMDLRNGVSQQCHSYATGGKLDASMAHALQLLLAEGRIREVEYDKDMFISPCFPKAKPGRKFEGTDLDLVRILNDLRGVNERIADSYEEWAINNPTREGLEQSVPGDARWFGEIDLKDAFHWGVMHEDSQKYVVIYWKGKTYAWVGVPQGLRPASAYYTAMITHLLNTALGGAGLGPNAKPDPTSPTDGQHGGGAAWSAGKWYMGWIDDWMPMAPTEQRCINRQDILLDVFRCAGLPLSPKCKFKVSETGRLIGMHWTKDGHCLDDAAVESLMLTLSRKPVTKTDAKQIIGMITYSASAFDYTSKELSRHAELMAILNASVEKDRIRWDHECEAAMAELRERMRNLSRKMYDPLKLLDENHCLVMMGDAAETGIGAGLFLVNKGNADDVVPADMTAESTILMDVYHKVLDSGQRRWQVFELEAYAMYCSTKKWGKYISRALYDKEWTVNKIAMLTDSTTAAVKWFNIQLPDYHIDHLCAKGKRFLGWADKIAYSATWPMCTRHVPGEVNCLAHMLSHVGDLLSAMGKHGDGTMTAAQASQLLKSEMTDKGYLS